jgi:hypothetical protein
MHAATNTQHGRRFAARGARVARLARCERGGSLVMVTGAAVAIFAFAALAIDGAILMSTRTQLHNAADAAALAGATALIQGDREEARRRAIEIAGRNEAYQNGNAPVVITEDDISFPESDLIRVVTHRTRERGDALRTFFMRVIDPSSDDRAEMTASAAARVYDVCSSRCLKPWAIPDRWKDDNGNGWWDPGEYYHPDGTGYRAPGDVGTSVALKVGRPGQTIAPGIFYVINFPPLDSGDGDPLTGAAWYRRWVADCSPYVIRVGDRLQLEPGRMVGPTSQAVRDLIALDPGAHWDSSTQSVQGSAFTLSPRIGLIPFFDPTVPPGPGRNHVTVVKLGAFFIERVDATNEVKGRFIQITTQGASCPGGSGSSLVKGIALVE